MSAPVEPDHNRVDAIINEVVNEFVRRQHYGGCLPASAMAARFIPNAKVICGYKVCKYGAYAHSWVRIDNTDYDVGTMINAQMLDNSELTYVLEESLSQYESMHRFDRETQKEMSDSVAHENLIELFQKKPAIFWKRALGWQRRWRPPTYP